MRVKCQLSSRDTYKHKGCQSCKPTGSAPKQGKRSVKEQTALVILVAELEVRGQADTPKKV